MTKFVRVVAGQLTEEATITVSAGAADVGKIPDLDATGRLDASVMPSGIGAETQTLTASEALAANDLINIHSGGMRKADNSNGRKAHGFVKSAVANAASGQAFLEGKVPGTFVLGTTYYLGTAGAVTATAPTASGTTVQELGVATSTTELDFNPQRTVLLV